MSPAGSAWASVPPIVPRWRTCGSAIVFAAAAARPSSGENSTVRCVVIAPIRNCPFSRWMPCRPGTLRMSTSSDGAASRSFMSGISECPPASTFASSPPSDSRRMASSRLSGAA